MKEASGHDEEERLNMDTSKLTLDNLDTIDTRSDVEKAPKKKTEAKAPKAPKKKAEPKPAWAPSEAVANVIALIGAIDHFDKKGIAQIVKASIALRTDGLATRERAEINTSDDNTSK